MVSEKIVESVVGLFFLAALTALLVLALKVSGLTSFFKSNTYQVTADFDDIGQLKVRSAVKMGGVVVGEVSGITLDSSTFKAVVKMRIHANVNTIPSDSSVSILTAGLLGDNYLAITPMYSSEYLKNGSKIQDTHSAMILEKLIGQMLFKVNKSAAAESQNTTNTGVKS